MVHALFPPCCLLSFVSRTLAAPAHLLHAFPNLHVVLEDAGACCTSSAPPCRICTSLISKNKAKTKLSLANCVTSPNLVGPPPPPNSCKQRSRSVDLTALVLHPLCIRKFVKSICPIGKMKLCPRTL